MCFFGTDRGLDYVCPPFFLCLISQGQDTVFLILPRIEVLLFDEPCLFSFPPPITLFLHHYLSCNTFPYRVRAFSNTFWVRANECHNCAKKAITPSSPLTPRAQIEPFIVYIKAITLPHEWGVLVVEEGFGFGLLLNLGIRLSAA